MKKMMTEYIRSALEIDDAEMIDELIDSFIVLLNETLSKMRSAYTQRDFSELRTLAHTLKGSAANIGAEPLRAASLALQLSSDAKDEAACGSRIDEIETLRETIGD